MYTNAISKLTPKERKRLIYELCQAISLLKSTEEAADLLTDLLSPKEIETIAKRLKIAEFLISGDNYDLIRKVLKVGYSTIARVNTWLNLSGIGFKTVISRKPKEKKEILNEEKYDPYSWYNIKRRYTLYYWPQLLLEEIFKSSDQKQIKKVMEKLEKLESKGKRFSSEDNKELYRNFSSKFIYGARKSE